MHLKFQKGRCDMDISKWPLDMIIALPDWCFGRKYPVSITLRANSDTLVFDIAEMALPEPCVLWSIHIEPYYVDHHNGYMRLALGEQLVTTEAEFMLFTPLIHGFGSQGNDPRKIENSQYTGPLVLNIRQVLDARGRKLTGMAIAVVDKSYRCRVTIVVSSIPKEVPDWVVSGLEGVR